MANLEYVRKLDNAARMIQRAYRRSKLKVMLDGIMVKAKVQSKKRMTDIIREIAEDTTYDPLAQSKV